MADREHLENIAQGTDAWNRWRTKNRSARPDLSSADLREASLRSANLNHAILRDVDLTGANLERSYLEAADLRGACLRNAHLFDAVLERADLGATDLTESQLWRCHLAGARLRDACLVEADLRQADLGGADLRGADLRGANLEGAQLFRTDLRRANLEGAILNGAQLWETALAGARLAGAEMAVTALDDVDLSRTEGLDAVRHRHASSIGVPTLDHTAFGLTGDPSRRAEVERFLRQAGVREAYLDVFRAAVNSPPGVSAVFLRYSTADREVAGALHDALQDRGVRCWLQEHPMLPGEPIDERVDPSLRPSETVLLLCSEASLTSWWIEAELDRAAADESRLAERLGTAVPRLRTVDLDGYLMGGNWASRREPPVRERVVAEVHGWSESPKTLARGVERVVEALGEGAPGTA